LSQAQGDTAANSAVADSDRAQKDFVVGITFPSNQGIILSQVPPHCCNF
jgi:hypothetical protein